MRNKGIGNTAIVISIIVIVVATADGYYLISGFAQQKSTQKPSGREGLPTEENQGEIVPKAGDAVVIRKTPKKEVGKLSELKKIKLFVGRPVVEEKTNPISIETNFVKRTEGITGGFSAIVFKGKKIPVKIRLYTTRPGKEEKKIFQDNVTITTSEDEIRIPIQEFEQNWRKALEGTLKIKGRKEPTKGDKLIRLIVEVKVFTPSKETYTARKKIGMGFLSQS